MEERKVVKDWIVIVDKSSSAAEALPYEFALYARMLQHPELHVLRIKAGTEKRALERAHFELRFDNIRAIREHLTIGETIGLTLEDMKDVANYILSSMVYDVWMRMNKNVSLTAQMLHCNRKSVYTHLDRMGAKYVDTRV